MASADDDIVIPSLSAPVLLRGNNGYRYRDGLPTLFNCQNWPPTATAIGKHTWLWIPSGILENSREFRRISDFRPFFDPISSDSGSGSDRISCSCQNLACRNYVPTKIFPNFFIGKLLPPFLLAWYWLAPKGHLLVWWQTSYMLPVDILLAQAKKARANAML